MAAEYGAHFFGQKNRAAAAVRDADRCKRRVQVADAGFEPLEAGGGLASANIEAGQIARGVFDGAVAEGKARRQTHVTGDATGAEDDAGRFEQPSPPTANVDVVKRATPAP